MSDPFASALLRLASGANELCEHRADQTSVFDDEASERLSQRYEAAVSAFTDAFGDPSRDAFRFPDLEVECAACWERPGKILYAAVSLEDNTRLRTLIVGVRRARDLERIPADSDWWSRPAWGTTR